VSPASADVTRPSIPSFVPPDWPHRAASRAIDAGGVRWHVQQAGQGPVVLLLHGSGASSHSWADVLPILARRATVVAPDLPGHGFSTGADDHGYTLTGVADSLEALLARLALGPVAVVAGHSAGAALAIRWALETGRAPSALVGFAPSLVPPPQAYTTFLAPFVTPVATSALATSLLASIAGPARLVDRLLDSTRSSIPDTQRARYGALFRNRDHVRGTMRFMAAADLAALLEDAKRLDVPATFVLGARDDWVPGHSLRPILARSFPDAEVETWDDGHLLHEVEPERAARVIADRIRPGERP
jgi:magnesium chelatase accessory protein